MREPERFSMREAVDYYQRLLTNANSQVSVLQSRIRVLEAQVSNWVFLAFLWAILAFVLGMVVASVWW